MKSVVVYASRYGNTKQVAEAVAAGLRREGPVQLVAVEGAAELPGDTDLVVIGGPTEKHGVSELLAGGLEWLAPALAGRWVAVFDTRIKGPRWLWGSAAADAGRTLRRAGAKLVVEAESFFVSGPQSEPQLLPGELERADRWAVAIASAMPVPVTA